MSIDATELKAILSRIDANLEMPQTVCLIGSAATIMLGQPSRAAHDLDVWAAASKVEIPSFRRAIEGAGLDFDPCEDFPTLPYVQVIHPGIVQVPGYDAKRKTWFDMPEKTLWRGKRLLVTCPPGAAIVASKLLRASERDLEDCLWLMASGSVTANMVIDAIKKLPPGVRSDARDNLEVLGYMGPRD